MCKKYICVTSYEEFWIFEIPRFKVRFSRFQFRFSRLPICCELWFSRLIVTSIRSWIWNLEIANFDSRESELAISRFQVGNLEITNWNLEISIFFKHKLFIKSKFKSIIYIVLTMIVMFADTATSFGTGKPLNYLIL